MALLIVAALVLLLVYFLSDRWLESQIESVASAAVGARVELDGFDFSPFSLQIAWQRLQVTDPKNTMRNLFETGPVSFKISPEPLFYKKVVIETVQLDSLRTNTPRQTDGALPQKPESPAALNPLFKKLESYVQKEAANMPVFNPKRITQKVNVDSIYAMANLQAPVRADSLQKAVRENADSLQKQLAELEKKLNPKDYQARLNRLQQIDFKNPVSIKNGLDEASALYKDIEALQKEYRSLRSEFDRQVAEIKASPSLLQQWIQEDYRRVLQLAQLPDISVKNVSRMLFGPQILTQVETATRYLATARKYAAKLSSGKPEKSSPPRLQGQNIHFSSRLRWPDFLLRDLRFSGEGPHRFLLSGQAANITGQSELVGRPITIRVDGKRKDRSRLSLQAELRYHQPRKSELVTLKISDLPMNNVQLSDFPLLPYPIQKANVNISAEMRFLSDTALCNIAFDAASVTFDLEKPRTRLDARLAPIARELAANIRTIQLNANVKMLGSRFSLNMSSNLDRLVADHLSGIVSRQVTQARQQLQERVDREIAAKKASLEKLVSEHTQKLEAEVEQIRQEIEKRRQEIEKRKTEILAKAEEEKNKAKKRLEEEAKKKLKGLF
ncbi:MAG: TIGR03545 family protein [Calditrichia bacterium]